MAGSVNPLMDDTKSVNYKKLHDMLVVMNNLFTKDHASTDAKREGLHKFLTRSKLWKLGCL
jgi:hypothetical protein